MKSIIRLIITLFVLLIAAMTNPSKDNFIAWAKEKVKDNTSGIAALGIELFGNNLISSVTTTNNYVFFTIFDARFSETENIKVLGIFHNFIPLSTIVMSSQTTSVTQTNTTSENLTAPKNSNPADNQDITINQAQQFINTYLQATMNTFNNRDMSYINSYVEPNSEEWNSTASYITTLEKKGIHEILLDAKVTNVQKADTNIYNITVMTKFDISSFNGQNRHVSSFQSIYQVVKNGDSLLVRQTLKDDLLSTKNE